MKAIFAAFLLATTVVAGQASAAVINPTANFTLRSTTNAGPASAMDSTWGNGGFEGFITNLEGSQVDHTYLEYSMAGFGGPVASATLDFTMSGSAGDIVSMGSYAANGIAELAEWSTTQTPFTTFGAGAGVYSIDITALINATLGGPAFIGFGFSVDPHPQQAFFAMSAAPAINFTAAAAPIPEPSTVLLMGSGLAGLAVLRRRSGQAKRHQSAA